MKKNKIVFILLSLFFVVACKDARKNETSTISEKDVKDEVITSVDEYKDTNPIKLSLYVNKSRVSEFKSSMNIFEDIVSLECYYTEDNMITDGKFKDVFNSYYTKYSNIDDYRIGYRIKFDTSDGNFDKYIFRPSDVYNYFDYIQTYLYDDIHQDSSWYSHVEDGAYNDNTLLTSIKLTASKYIDRVTSDYCFYLY